MEALYRALGVAGMMRFMQQYEAGRGDYTRNHHRLIGNPAVDELFANMKNYRTELAAGAVATPS